MTKKKISSSNKRPVGVTILAVLAYIGAVFSLLGGLALIIGSAAISSLILKFAPGIDTFPITTALFVIVGVIFLVCAVINYCVARGLWKGKNWARILVIIIAALSLISSLWPFDIVGIIISGLIIWYLGFYKPAIAYFK